MGFLNKIKHFLLLGDETKEAPMGFKNPPGAKKGAPSGNSISYCTPKG
jgi:hypothetical protein